MSYSRLLLSASLKNAVAYKVARRTLASEAHSRCGSADSKDPLTTSDALPPTLILRVFRNKEGKCELTPEGEQLDKDTKGKLKRYVEQLTDKFKVGSAVVVTAVGKYEAVALGCCGPKDADVNNVEALNEKRENYRWCYGRAAWVLHQQSIWHMPEFEKSITDQEFADAMDGLDLTSWRPQKVYKPYKTGQRYARVNAQNWARHLSHLPPNKRTPAGVVEEARSRLGPLSKNISIKSYDKTSEETKNMHAFLAVAQGSSQPPLLLECSYKGKEGAPYDVLMMANGVTSDSGGLCLKKRDDMLMHSGMTGAAAALGVMWGLAEMKASKNVVLLVPLCENMISGQCLKVGDVVSTLKGYKVKIEDTGLEGALMLADVLTYGQKTFNPKHVMSVASLTPGITKATGGGCYGCFTDNDKLWDIASKAGAESGDRPWRFPIWDYYGKQITDDSSIFNLKNRGPGIASHCLGAAFLKKFVTSTDNWLHYDVTGVGKMARGETPIYLDPNLMTGRPTRALLETIVALE